MASDPPAPTAVAAALLRAIIIINFLPTEWVMILPANGTETGYMLLSIVFVVVSATLWVAWSGTEWGIGGADYRQATPKADFHLDYNSGNQSPTVPPWRDSKALKRTQVENNLIC